MIFHPVKRLLKTKYNGCKMYATRVGDNEYLTLYVGVLPEFDTDVIKETMIQEIKDLTGTDFIEIVPIIELPN